MSRGAIPTSRPYKTAPFVCAALLLASFAASGAGATTLGLSSQPAEETLDSVVPPVGPADCGDSLHEEVHCEEWRTDFSAFYWGDNYDSVVTHDNSKIVLGTGWSYFYELVAVDSAGGGIAWATQVDRPGHGWSPNSGDAEVLQDPHTGRIHLATQTNEGYQPRALLVAADVETGELLSQVVQSTPAPEADEASHYRQDVQRDRVLVVWNNDPHASHTGDYFVVAAHPLEEPGLLWSSEAVGGFPRDVALSADGSRFYVTGDLNWVGSNPGQFLAAFDAEGGGLLWHREFLHPSPDSVGGADRMALSPDGSRIALVGGWLPGTVHLFDAGTGGLVWRAAWTYDGPEPLYGVREATFSTDSHTVFALGALRAPSTTFARQNMTVAALRTEDGVQLWSDHYRRDGSVGSEVAQAAVNPADGSLVVLARGRASSSNDDMVTLVYEPDTGERRWTAEWSRQRESDRPVALAVSGDGARVYSSGTSQSALGAAFATDRVRGTYQTLLAYDAMNASVVRSALPEASASCVADLEAPEAAGCSLAVGSGTASCEAALGPLPCQVAPAVGPPDADGDGHGDATDNCVFAHNPGQEDLDGDAAGDACDWDRDGDGRENWVDDFPSDPSEKDDLDGDGVGDNSDNCRYEENPGQEDFDGDGRGDHCDDSDDDGSLDSEDNCPLTENSGQSDLDGDGAGDACDAEYEARAWGSGHVRSHEENRTRFQFRVSTVNGEATGQFKLEDPSAGGFESLEILSLSEVDPDEAGCQGVPRGPNSLAFTGVLGGERHAGEPFVVCVQDNDGTPDRFAFQCGGACTFGTGGPEGAWVELLDGNLHVRR